MTDEACPQVVHAAFAVLREMALRDEGDGAPRRLAELLRAHGAICRARGWPDQRPWLY